MALAAGNMRREGEAYPGARPRRETPCGTPPRGRIRQSPGFPARAGATMTAADKPAV